MPRIRLRRNRGMNVKKKKCRRVAVSGREREPATQDGDDNKGIQRQAPCRSPMLSRLLLPAYPPGVAEVVQVGNIVGLTQPFLVHSQLQDHQGEVGTKGGETLRLEGSVQQGQAPSKPWERRRRGKGGGVEE